jgi:hypothetical protein
MEKQSLISVTNSNFGICGCVILMVQMLAESLKVEMFVMHLGFVCYYPICLSFSFSFSLTHSSFSFSSLFQQVNCFFFVNVQVSGNSNFAWIDNQTLLCSVCRHGYFNLISIDIIIKQRKELYDYRGFYRHISVSSNQKYACCFYSDHSYAGQIGLIDLAANFKVTSNE